MKKFHTRCAIGCDDYNLDNYHDNNLNNNLDNNLDDNVDDQP